ncbi:MAG: UDP-4-amino-4,6-dideoxy-N-acetyl-beta-L-altrosamine N-acetyltransferase [Pseudomonadota bacterium]
MPCRLRSVREEDLEMVREWRMRPEITRYMYTDPQVSPDDQKAWFERISASLRDRIWIIELIDGEVPVGLLSLSDIDRTHGRACWAYYIADERARGKGLARSLELNIYRYVFERMGLKRLWCEVLAFNERVVAIHEKFGSSVEGVLRKHIHKGDEAHDVVRMAILADEWLSIRNKFDFEAIEIEDQE